MIRDIENGTITLSTREDVMQELERYGCKSIQDLDKHLWYSCGICLLVVDEAKRMLEEELL